MTVSQKASLLPSSTNEACGVALILTNQKGQFFCVKELIAKEAIGKHQGDYSFPWETKQGKESDEQTLERLLEEEVHGEALVEISSPEWVGEFTLVPGTEARVYTALFIKGPETLRGLHEGIEIEALGWQSKELLLAHGRRGIKQALELLEQHQKKSSRTQTLA